MDRLTFHGAAETVTGSKYLLESGSESGDSRVLIDCGLFQGLKELRARNWERLPFDPASVESIVLTHAHIDHIGYLPRFVRTGFRGPIYCTRPTAELCELQLYDTARMEEEDAEYANRKGYSKHRPALPLFDQADVNRTLKLLRPVDRDDEFQAAGHIWCKYKDVGHLLGSAMIEVELRHASRTTRVLFSGDVGRYNAPLYHDPSPPSECDYLICESTYGDRDHAPEPVLDQLAEAIMAGVERGGVIVMAAFAIGRAQQLVYLLHVLEEHDRIPKIPIYVDSPMAIEATQIYKRYAADHDLAEAQITAPGWKFSGEDVVYTRSVSESKALNGVRGPAVIISSSGMMTGGRILHHLRQRLPHEENTILLGGYMAPGTRGRLLFEGKPTLRMHGRDVPVHAAVARIPALSGHADHRELLRWLEPLPPPKLTFLTHGEPASATALAEELRHKRGWNTVVPRYGETFELPEVVVL
jgi:metallo-beta-lactamase family protein